MFFMLLASTLGVSLLVSMLSIRFFKPAMELILTRVLDTELMLAWKRYLNFVILVVGISGGVRLWDVEKYLTATKEATSLSLDGARWFLEIYRTLLETLQSIAWVMLIFFVFSMIAYVIVRAYELKSQNKH